MEFFPEFFKGCKRILSKGFQMKQIYYNKTSHKYYVKLETYSNSHDVTIPSVIR